MTLHHRIVGSGPTVILVHGIIHRGHAWDAVVPLLSDRHRVVVVDLSGHGESADVPDDVEPVSYMADELAEFVEEVTPAGERAHIVGNSLGGFLALEMGARGLVSGVTALSPAGFFRHDLDRNYTRGLFRGIMAAAKATRPAVPMLSRSAVGRSLFMGVFCTKPWRYPAETMKIDALSIEHNKVVGRLLDGDFLFSEPVDELLPITVLWGRFDFVLPAGQAKIVRRVFPQARVEITVDGHVPMTDNPEAVALAIADDVQQALARVA